MTRGARALRSSRMASSSTFDLDAAVGLVDADAGGEEADAFGRVAAAAQAGDGGHARVIPARHVFLLDQLEQLALAHHRVVEVEAGKLVLVGRGSGKRLSTSQS